MSGVELDVLDMVAEFVVGTEFGELTVALDRLYRGLDFCGDYLSEGAQFGCKRVVES